MQLKIIMLSEYKIICPTNWKEYELIDTGDFEKLERFGRYTLRRPEPQAFWNKSLQEEEWTQKAHATFIPDGSHSGDWKSTFKLPNRWALPYQTPDYEILFNLSLTKFKHVGIFPEQAANWDFIFEQSKRQTTPRVLNLFAYTGGATLAANRGGSVVTHLDAIKQVVTWANDNAQINQMSNIRWLIEDAMKFVEKEAKRGHLYSGIIMDPPSWGHGPNGEKWKLEDSLNQLLKACATILMPQNSFLVINSYSLNLSSLVLENLIRHHFTFHKIEKTEYGELYLEDSFHNRLPTGVFARIQTSR